MSDTLENDIAGLLPRLLSGAKKAQLREDPYVALPDAA